MGLWVPKCAQWVGIAHKVVMVLKVASTHCANFFVDWRPRERNCDGLIQFGVLSGMDSRRASTTMASRPLLPHRQGNNIRHDPKCKDRMKNKKKICEIASMYVMFIDRLAYAETLGYPGAEAEYHSTL